MQLNIRALSFVNDPFESTGSLAFVSVTKYTTISLCRLLFASESFLNES